ncbi:MAG: hypothetical protein NW220_00940 [Leptolyngbyaceae cyanobacterium bins.349]|nr:hypothetical protein [Leptolyngbyaceae cyanobacterium bins.349]
MHDYSLNETISAEDFNHLVEAIVAAVVKLNRQADLTAAFMVRDELRRLPNALLTEVLNQVILRLVAIDPLIGRWFIVEVFLEDAPPEGKADVAERMNILLADLQRSNPDS